MLGSLNLHKYSRKSLSSDQDEDPRAVRAMDIGRVPRAGQETEAGEGPFPWGLQCTKPSSVLSQGTFPIHHRPLLHFPPSLGAAEMMSRFISLCWPGTAPFQHSLPLPWRCPSHFLGSQPRTHDPSTSMKMKVFRMLVVCFFQELQSSSSFRPIASRVEASGDALFEEGKKGSAQLVSQIK